MFRTLAVLALFAAPVRADDKPQPNALTAKEIADGWVMLFDGESTFGWKVEGEAKVKDGWIVFGGEMATSAQTTTRGVGGNIYLEAEWSGAKRPELYALGIESPASLLRDTKPNTLIPWPLSANPEGNAKARPLAPVRLEVPAGSELKLRRVRYHPFGYIDLNETKVGGEKLFNGKDLTGWKVNGADPKRAASKWSVTKEGELAVKDGPGDLVCEKEFANFVLQFECKTNGKALNSGIFFRCIPGQYQNGYEAQIQNAYKDDDRTKPADFGTGAIYRRIAARKVVSNDNEWFTMTVAANGKHIATWVNGYQTVDWTDDRKENDNPRQGYRAAKGPLSIQGHDPTTDILFRNIRASELPAK